MLTGASILQLVAAGKLRLADRVEQHLGAFPSEKRGATIEHLVSHTSGLIVAGSTLASETREAFVRDVKATPRESSPGERYRYTNAGYSVLAAIIERTTGQTYEEYLRQRIFAPAGMRTALFRTETPAGDSLIAQGYVGTPTAIERGPPNPYVWGTIGAGGVYSTVGDMYRWLVAVEDGAVLPETERRLIFSEPRPPSVEAFGWHVNAATPTARARIDKGGGSADFASQLLYYPNERVAIIWASNNLRQRWRQTLNQALPAIVFGDSAQMLPPMASMSARALAGYAGLYAAGSDTLRLHAADTHLYAGANALKVPADVLFFPTDNVTFAGFDPASRMLTRIWFRGPTVLELGDGRVLYRSAIMKD
jgi:CubicO group peptidase (beta-lactamase class C family)